MTEFNVAMLTLARERRGWTMETLATEAGISRSKVSKYEAGLLPVSDEDADKFAKKLDYPREFFFESFVRAADTSHIFHHRKKASLTITKTREIHALADATRFHVQRLLTDVQVEAPGIANFDIDAFDGDVEQIATLVRASWGLPAGPVANMVEATEEAGAIVILADFGTRALDALSQHTPCLPPVIFLNRDMPTDRQRLTLAHEVGHLTMHRVPHSTDPEEEANAFAGAFLMPEAEFRAEVGRDTSLGRFVALKPRWKVSVQAMVFRAKQLKMLSAQQYENLYKRMSAMGWRRGDEPMPIPPERPSLMRRIVETHAREHGLSVSDLSRMARIHEHEFRALFLDVARQVRVLRGPVGSVPPVQEGEQRATS